MSSTEQTVPETPPTPWHAMPADEVARQLGVDPRRGLAASEAAGRLAGHGRNKLPHGKKKVHRA